MCPGGNDVLVIWYAQAYRESASALCIEVSHMGDLTIVLGDIGLIDMNRLLERCVQRAATSGVGI